jgi:hypothetical protein
MSPCLCAAEHLSSRFDNLSPQSPAPSSSPSVQDFQQISFNKIPIDRNEKSKASTHIFQTLTEEAQKPQLQKI